MQFQSTLPRRERRRKPKQGTNHVNISIRAPAKGATHPIRDLQRKDRVQSTLPRRERRRKPKQGTNHVNISTHAPAKGATHRIRDLQRKDRFQSTLPRRERHRLHLIKRSDMNFNPRSREGSDVAALAICDANTNFNPRSREGSDGKYLYGIRRQHHFNPRSREGSDDLRQMGQGRPCRFQSTLPRRERLPIGWSHPSWSNFNPRSREGSDVHSTGRLSTVLCISIHAPAKGATN